jgi:hypothetical protein
VLNLLSTFSLLWPHPCCLKRLQNSLFLKGSYPGVPEQWKEVTLLEWEEALAPVKVGGEALGVG